MQNLFKLSENSNISKSTILSPNIVEFKRIWTSLFEEEYAPQYTLEDIYSSLENDIGQLDPELQISLDVQRMSLALNGVIILKVIILWTCVLIYVERADRCNH